MKIVIVGAGEVGSHLAKMLRRASNDVTVIDSEQSRLNALTSTVDLDTVCGSPTSIGVLREAGADTADLFIAVFPFVPQEVNIVSALLAKSIGAAKVTARVSDENFLTSENKLLFKELGMELMFYPEKIAADEIVEGLSHNSAGEMLDFAHGKLQIAAFKLNDESDVLDMTVGEFASSAANDFEFRIIAISRDGETIIPGVSTKFKYQDVVFAISKREGVEKLMKLFGRNSVEIGKVMIMGGSSIAAMVAQGLKKKVDTVKIIERSKERCIELAEKLGESVLIANGDARNSDFLLDENIRDYDAFVALTGSDEANVLACVTAKRFGIERTVAEVENIEYMRLAEDMGIDTIINKKLITAARIFKFTLSGKARTVKYMSGTQAEILEYTVAPDSKITRTALKDAGFPSQAIIGGVIRGNDSFIAVGDSVIEPYDRVVVFAMPGTVKEVDSFFRQG